MQLDVLLQSTPADLVFMDCDGVIYDTNALKCDAYRFALDTYPSALVEALVVHHRATGGVSRYLKLERFFREMHVVAEPELQLRRALERFSEYCERGYDRMRARPEALAFAALMGGAARVHVVSGSDEAELRRVFDAADLRPCFKEIHGSPVIKKAHITRICHEAGVAPARCLFVGDGWGDWDTATSLGVPFVFLAEMSEWESARESLAGAGVDDRVSEAPTWASLLQSARRAGWRPPR